MDKELSELKKEIREKLKLDFIVPDDIPDMELYMEQLTGFMEEHLKNNLRGEEDKILTKAMINNYTKNKLVPPPEKKKYDRDHLILLIYIYYLKHVVSIEDIRKIMKPIVEKEMDSEKLFEVYTKTFEMEKPQYFNIESSVVKAAQIADKKIPKEDDEYLNKLLFIFMLGYDIYSKKRLIEKLIEELPSD
ncbi:MAG: DUF1836 domain-containing protein [Eubacterium sp.]|nr:DUF1836 domain-containing protein [Eubacterium sp.]